MLLYFMVVIMNAPLPTPSKTTANGNTQHREETNAGAILQCLIRSLFRIFSGHAALKGFTIEGTDLQCGEIISASEEPPTASYPPKVLKAVQLTNDYVAKYHGDLGMFATVFFGVLYPVAMIQCEAGGGQVERQQTI